MWPSAPISCFGRSAISPRWIGGSCGHWTSTGEQGMRLHRPLLGLRPPWGCAAPTRGHLCVTAARTVSVARITVAREAQRARTSTSRKGVQDRPLGDIVTSGGSVGPRHCYTRILFFPTRHPFLRLGEARLPGALPPRLLRPALSAEHLWGSASGLTAPTHAPPRSALRLQRSLCGRGRVFPFCGRVPVALASGVQPPPLGGSVGRVCSGLPCLLYDPCPF